MGLFPSVCPFARPNSAINRDIHIRRLLHRLVNGFRLRIHFNGLFDYPTGEKEGSPRASLSFFWRRRPVLWFERGAYLLTAVGAIIRPRENLVSQTIKRLDGLGWLGSHVL